MRLFRYFRVALESILAHKMRAILTMLGIIIGVAAVLITSGIGQGAAASITSRISSQGTNLITISPGANSFGGVRQASGSASTLTMADAQALTDKSLHPDIELVAPVSSGNTQLVAGSLNTQRQVVGVTMDYFVVRNLEMDLGRFFELAEIEGMAHLLVLGATVAEELFAGQDPIGQSVRVENQPFQVVGVLTESGSNFGGVDTQALVPIGVAQGRLFPSQRYRGDYSISTIYVGATAEERVASAKLQIEQTLRLRHALKPADSNDFSITDQASLLETLSSVTATLTIFLGSIGAISLLVGGIGVMNIMLVSVTERTREIGLRRALGAHDSDILLQFLVESLVLTILGGLIGISLSYSVAWAVMQAPAIDFKVLITPNALILALSVSALSGLLFGLYPAMRATRLDPIEALRYE